MFESAMLRLRVTKVGLGILFLFALVLPMENLGAKYMLLPIMICCLMMGWGIGEAEHAQKHREPVPLHSPWLPVLIGVVVHVLLFVYQ